MRKTNSINSWWEKDISRTLNWHEGILAIIIAASGENTKSPIASSISNQINPNTWFANIRLSNEQPLLCVSPTSNHWLTWPSSRHCLLRIRVGRVFVALFHRWSLLLHNDRLDLVCLDYEPRRIAIWRTRIWNRFEHHRWPKRLGRYWPRISVGTNDRSLKRVLTLFSWSKNACTSFQVQIRIEFGWKVLDRGKPCWIQSFACFKSCSSLVYLVTKGRESVEDWMQRHRTCK